MARGVNKVILIGNSGGDPQMRYLPNGNAVTNLNLATSDSWQDKQTGQQQTRTQWHRIVVYGTLAEVAAQYLRKGSQVYLEGRLQTREWEKDGVTRYTTEVVVDMQGALQLLGRKDSQQEEAAAPGDARPSPAPRPSPSAARPASAAADYENFDDDIPFFRIDDRLVLII